jgi:hypothetical protein
VHFRVSLEIAANTTSESASESDGEIERVRELKLREFEGELESREPYCVELGSL